jgi:hypothetical protein
MIKTDNLLTPSGKRHVRASKKSHAHLKKHLLDLQEQMDRWNQIGSHQPHHKRRFVE